MECALVTEEELGAGATAGRETNVDETAEAGTFCEEPSLWSGVDDGDDGEGGKGVTVVLITEEGLSIEATTASEAVEDDSPLIGDCCEVLLLASVVDDNVVSVDNELVAGRVVLRKGPSTRGQ